MQAARCTASGTVCVQKVIPLSTNDVNSMIGLLNDSYALILLFLFSHAKLFVFVYESEYYTVVYTFIRILLF